MTPSQGWRVLLAALNHKTALFVFSLIDTTNQVYISHNPLPIVRYNHRSQTSQVKQKARIIC
mgnify:FL=1